MLSGESIFTKKACIADAPVICFTPNARMASGVKVSNAEANFSVSISRQSASIQSGVPSSSVRVFDIFHCPSTGAALRIGRLVTMNIPGGGGLVLRSGACKNLSSRGLVGTHPPCPSCGLQLTSGGVGGIFGLGVEGNRGVWRGLMDDVHHGLEQRQTFGRESEATTDHHTVIVGARQRLLEHGAPSGIWRDHARIALPPVFLDLFDAQGDPGVDLFGIEAGRQGRV